MKVETQTQTQTTCHLQNLEYNQYLKLAKGFFKISDRLYIEETESSDNGTWTRKSDFKRFVNKLERYNTKVIQNFIVGKNNKIDFGFCIVKKANIKYVNDGLNITFKSPIKVYFGQVGDKPIFEEVKSLQGKLMYDFYNRGCNITGVELFIEEIEFLN